MKFEIVQSLLYQVIKDFKVVCVAVLQFFTLIFLVCDLNLDFVSQVLLICLHLFHSEAKMVSLYADILCLRDFHAASFVQVLLKTSKVGYQGCDLIISFLFLIFENSDPFCNCVHLNVKLLLKFEQLEGE